MPRLRPFTVLIVLAWGLVAAMGGVVLVINARLSAPAPGVPVGAPAPDIALPTHAGRPFHLSDYRGRPVVLAFVPDLALETGIEARSLATVLERLEESGGKVFVVCPDAPEAARAFHVRERLPYPVLVDRSGAVARTYGVAPGGRETVVVAPSGKVGYHIRGVDVARHGPQVIAVSQGCAAEVVAARVRGVGERVSDLSLPRADGGEMASLLGDGRAKATVLLFLSVRCPCANAYNARVRDLVARLPRRGVRVVAVYSSVDEPAAEVAEHARAQGFEGIPVLKDERLLAADHVKATVTPQAFVIDRSGVLRYAGRIDDKREPSKVTRRDLEAAVDAVLAGRKVPASQPAFGCAIPRTPV